MLSLSLPILAIPGDNIVFPADAGVVDVTKAPYFVKNDGSEAVDSLINKAFDENCNKNAIIYLPNGTYLVRNTIRWSDCGVNNLQNQAKNTILQGQNESETVIVLDKNSPGFQDKSNHQPVIYTGHAPATKFRNAIHNITVVVDSGNPGASGIEFFANNQGVLREVTIISKDRQGVAGVDCARWADNGPFLGKNIAIVGFDYGIWMDGEHASMTFEHVNLREQNTYGIWNKEQPATFRGVVSTNQVPVLHQSEVEAFTTIVEGTFTGTGGASDEAAMVIDSGGFFARDIDITGYAKGVDNNVGTHEDFTGTKLVEFVSHPPLSLFDSPQHSLRLEIKETPDVPWDDTSGWVSPTHYGAISDDDVDDTEAFRQALDAGATTVYVPNGKYKVSGPLTIDGSVRRIMGCEAQINYSGPDGGILWDCKNGLHPTVVIERLQVVTWAADRVPDSTRGLNENGNYKKRKTMYKIKTSGSRSFVFRHINVGVTEIEGPGEVYFEDVVGGPINIGSQGKLWGRQPNIENGITSFGLHQFLNDGGFLWALGWKSETANSELKTYNGGYSELLGHFSYQSHVKGQDLPLIINHESNVSIVMSEMMMDTTVTEGHASGRWFGPPADLLVIETRDGVADTLNRGEAYWHPNENNPDTSVWSSMLPLYVGYKTSSVRDNPHVVRQGISVPPRRFLAFDRQSRYLLLPEKASGIELFDMKGRLVFRYVQSDLESSRRITIPKDLPRHTILTARFIAR